MNASLLPNSLAIIFLLAMPGVCLAADKLPGKMENIGVVEETIDTDAAEIASEPAMVTALAPDAEGAGLYHGTSEGGFGSGFWNGTPRAVAAALIESLPVAARDPSTQKLLFGILLSKTNTKVFNEPAPEGRDLLTLRLNKLMQAGAYRQALDLYSSLELENPPRSVAQAGITAMLFAGEKSLACLELNTVQEQYGVDPFVKTVAAYCDATLSATPSPESLNVLNAAPDKLLVTLATKKSFSIVYSPADFEKYSLLEKAMLAAEAKILLPTGDHGNFSNVPPSHLQLVMKIPGLTDKEKFLLNTQMLNWGLLKAADYKKDLVSVVDIDERKDPALAVPESAEDWQQLPYLLLIATNKKSDSEKWPFILQAFSIGKKYGLSTLTPFAELLYKTAPKNDISLQEIQIVTNILNEGGFRLPPKYIDIINKFTDLPSKEDAYIRLLATAYLSDPNKESEEKLRSSLQRHQTPVGNFIINIIENLDKQLQDQHTAFAIYDNVLGLTLQSDYVMPSRSVWNRLLQAAKNGYIGETVSLATIVIGERVPENVYPGLLQDTLRSLDSVGLTDISANMAIAAVLAGKI